MEYPVEFKIDGKPVVLPAGNRRFAYSRFLGRGFAPAFLDSFETRLDSGKMESVIGQWKALSITLGRRVKIVTLHGETEGLAVDVDDNGSLILELTDGALKTIQYGDCFHL